MSLILFLYFFLKPQFSFILDLKWANGQDLPFSSIPCLQNLLQNYFFLTEIYHVIEGNKNMALLAVEKRSRVLGARQRSAFVSKFGVTIWVASNWTVLTLFSW